MLLRELFEAEKTGTVGIIFGRFNPPHKGHRAAWEMASENDDWFVGTNESTQGPKDPLPYNIKIQAMKTIMPEIDGHIVAETSWLTLASKVYRQYGDTTLNVYTDEDWVTKTIVQYNGKEGPHGFYKFSNIQQQPTPRLSSATALRTAVISNDKQAFADAAGVDADTDVAGHPFFDLVSHFLMPYQTAAKKPTVKKKKQEEPVEEGQYENDPSHVYDILKYALADAKKTGKKVVRSIGGYYKLAPLDDPRPALEHNRNRAEQIAKLKAEIDKLEQIRSVGFNNPEEYKKLYYKKYGPYYKGPGKLQAKLKKQISDIPYAVEKQTTEDAAGVGTITKQNTTKDVNKGTLRKMMKGFKLI